MGSKVFKRVLALCLAMVLMIASSMAVMAAEKSPGEGDVVPDPVIPTRTTFVIAKNNTIDLSYTQKNSVFFYVQWKSNFAYTYLFKISDKTNGTTGAVDGNGDPTDPEGLKPITFDAIVVDVDEELQQTITSISTNSITTYSEGAITNEYTRGKPIYVVVSNSSTGAVITPSGIGSASGKANVYKLNKSATESEVLGQLTGSPMGITFSAQSSTVETTIPLTDSTTPSIANVKFTPSTAGTYAYIYTTTKYVAPTYAIQTSGTYDSSKTYYMKSGSGAFFAVSVPDAAAFNENKAKLYLQTSVGTPGKYDVKIIKVQ